MEFCGQTSAEALYLKLNFRRSCVLRIIRKLKSFKNNPLYGIFSTVLVFLSCFLTQNVMRKP